MKKRLSGFDDHLKLREQVSAPTGRMPPEVEIRAVQAGDLPAEWMRWSDGARDAVILYLHGGGYVFGGLDSHREFAWRPGLAGSSL